MSVRAVLLISVAIAGTGFTLDRTFDREVPPRTGGRPDRNAEPRAVKVQAATVEKLDQPETFRLAATTQAYASANLYARATGYIVERRADIGSRVRKGDLLLRIAAPELDQQLVQAEAQIEQLEALIVQAKAQVDQSKATSRLAEQTNQRTSTLAGGGIVTSQNADTAQAGVLTQAANLGAAQANVKVAEANLEAQRAQVSRLKALTDFERIEAPFDGVVTARNTDIGSLVNADVNTGDPLLVLNRDDILRINIAVPGQVAANVQRGLQATIEVPSIPNRTFLGVVERSSSSLVSSARTLTTQVDIPNSTGELRPGQYVYASLAVPRIAGMTKVPEDALVFDQDGTHVAIIQADFTARKQHVEIHRQFGGSYELRAGLNGGEQVIRNPPPNLSTGQAIALKDATSP